MGGHLADLGNRCVGGDPRSTGEAGPLGPVCVLSAWTADWGRLLGWPWAGFSLAVSRRVAQWVALTCPGRGTLRPPYSGTALNSQCPGIRACLAPPQEGLPASVSPAPRTLCPPPIELGSHSVKARTTREHLREDSDTPTCTLFLPAHINTPCGRAGENGLNIRTRAPLKRVG